MESIGQIKEELTARSEVASLEQLEQRGKERVKIIRANHIATMIEEAVERALAEAGGNEDSMPRAEVDQLLAQTRNEFEGTLAQRAHEIEELEEELANAKERLAHFEALLPGGATAAPAAGAAAAASAEAAPAQGAGPDLASALDHLSDAMNDRLDKMSKKLGISTAVEADQVNYEHLFEDHGDAEIESNMDDLQVKKKTGSGIAANLEKLKKLKGGN